MNSTSKTYFAVAALGLKIYVQPGPENYVSSLLKACKAYRKNEQRPNRAFDLNLNI